MKKILIFIDWFLPGYKAGGPVRSVANMIEHLSDEFEFYIVTRDTEYLENNPYYHVISNQWNDFIPNVKVYYSDNNNPSLKQWRHLIREIKPDIVYINGIYSKFFSIYPLIAAKIEKKGKTIIAPRGMLSQYAIGIKSFKKRVFLLFAKLFLYKNIEWQATNSNEENDIKTFAGVKGFIHNIPNLPRKTKNTTTEIEKSPKILNLCTFARIAPEKNILFALNCLKNIHNEITITLDIFGQIYNNEYWEKCKIIITQLSENIKVNYCGVVEPEKITETISKYHTLLHPTLGENFGHIILESFMAARPVLISDQTPWRNLQEKKAGWDLPLIEIKFVETLKLISNMEQSDFDMLCKGAFELAKEYVSDDGLLEKYRVMINGY